jgi:hypothetical protein
MVQSTMEALDAIEQGRPATYDEVVTLLGGDRFPHVEGGARTLRSALEVAGWRVRWAEASDFYVVERGYAEVLTYHFGYLFAGDHRRGNGGLGMGYPVSSDPLMPEQRMPEQRGWAS